MEEDPTPMTPSLVREEALFLLALGQSPSDRIAFLERECGGDPALRLRLDALLAAHEHPGTLLAIPGAAALPAYPTVPPHQQDESPDAAAGLIIGRYKLLERLGEGGCGVVYVAEQAEPVRRRVALKVIKPGMDTKQVVARFEAERQALAMMDHPSIAKVFDAGVTDTSRPYFVMELVSGIPITEYCDQAKLGIYERLELFIKVCQAVQHAHQKGIIHRDIKPSNILVTNQDGAPVPKVIDFGIAKATEGRLTDATVSTQLHQFLGTPAYMSPEQAEMSGLDIDTRSDIYSLGVLLYELLTGKTPFDAKDLMSSGLDAMRRTIREKEPVRPSTRLRQMWSNASSSQASSALRHSPLSSDLDWIVMKSLEKDRARRYATVNSLAADLRRHLNHEPVVARPPGQFYAFHKFARRNRLAFAASSVVLFALISGFGISTWRFQKEREARQRASAAEQAEAELRREAEHLLHRTIAAEKEAEERLRESYLAQAHAYRWSGRPGRRFDSLDALAKAAAMQPSRELRMKLRNEAIACLALADLRAARECEAFPKGTTAFVADSQLTQYALGDENGEIRLRRVEDDLQLIRLPGTGLPVKKLLFGQDRQFLAAMYGNDTSGELAVWDLAQQKLALRRSVGLDARAFDLGQDNQLLALSQSDGMIVIVEVASGNEVERIAATPAPDIIRFSPQGGLIAYSSRESTVARIWDLKTRTLSRRLSHRGQVNDMAWDPEGTLLATACTDFDVYVWEAHQDGQPLLMKGHEAEPLSLAFSHRGDLLATAGADEGIRLWNPATGKRLAAILGTPVQAPLQFSQDDTQLGSASHGGPLRLYEVALGRERRTLHGHAGLRGPHHVDVSADGRLMASAGDDGVQIWDLDLGRRAGFLPVGSTMSVCFHPTRGDLVSSEIAGLHRWPRSAESAPGTGETRLGPAQHMGLPAGLGRACQSLDGQLLGVIHTNHVHLIHSNGQRRIVAVNNPSNLERIALSADGRWLAVSPGPSGEIQAWNTRSQILVRALDVGADASMAFSPDSRQLVTGTKREYRFWHVGTWKPGPVIPRDPNAERPGVMAFSRSGALLAVAFSRSAVQLIEPATATILTTLESPDSKYLSSLCFDPDARKLVAATEGHLIHVWDLPRIRDQLAPLGLDWESPSYPATPQTHIAAIQLKVDVGRLESGQVHLYHHLEQLTQRIETSPDNSELYHQRGHVHEQVGLLKEAVEDFNTVIMTRVSEAKLYWDRARVLSKLHQWDDALENCRQAIELAPGDPRPYELRASLHAARKEHSMAMIDLETWGELMPGNLDALHRRAHQFENIGEYNRAVADLSQVLEAPDADPRLTIHLLLSRANNFRLLGEHQKALADLRKATEREPDHPEACHALARFYVFSPAEYREPAKALRLMENAVAREPLNGVFISTVAMVHYRLGDFAKSEAELQIGVTNRVASLSGIGWFVLALSQHQLGRVVEAKEAYRRAMEWYRRLEAQGPKIPASLEALRAETEDLLGIGAH
jgi:WD40 repeat protein/tetratricopeptide (TPR) repeat protein/tRNA A-37 threonylcarbamoyl transferase component Bud32